MNWKRVEKTCPQPTSGHYRDWKPLLADEGNHQCVYCAISEASFGGIRNFHVEHFRPKSLFPDLTDVISNLFFACCICNVFKGADWPAEPAGNWSVPCYPCPSEHGYDEFLSVEDEGRVVGQNPTGNYLSERLFLNRPQLIMERRLASVRQRIRETLSEIQLLTPALEGAEDAQPARKYLSRLVRFVSRIAEAQIALEKLSPYLDAETRR